MTIKDIIAFNGFGFKGARGTLPEYVVAHPTILSSFSPRFLYDMKKLNQLYQDGVCSRLQGVM